MEAIGDHVGAILIAVVSAAGTVLVTLLKARGDKSMSIPDHYQGLMQEMKGWTTTQLEQRDRQLEQQGNRIENLERELRTWKDKFWVAKSISVCCVPLTVIVMCCLLCPTSSAMISE